jgi:hypothetical protein
MPSLNMLIVEEKFVEYKREEKCIREIEADRYG